MIDDDVRQVLTCIFQFLVYIYKKMACNHYPVYMFIYRHFYLPAVNGKFQQFTADKRPVNGKNTHFRNKKFMPAKCFKICIFYVYEISYCFFHFTFHVTLLFPLWLPNSISTKIRAFKREKIKLLRMKMKTKHGFSNE